MCEQPVFSESLVVWFLPNAEERGIICHFCSHSPLGSLSPRFGTRLSLDYIIHANRNMALNIAMFKCATDYHSPCRVRVIDILGLSQKRLYSF